MSVLGEVLALGYTQGISFENWIRSQSGAYYDSVEVNATVSASSTIELDLMEDYVIAAQRFDHIPIWTRVRTSEAPTNIRLAVKEMGESSVTFQIQTADSGPFDTGPLQAVAEVVFLPVQFFVSGEE